MSALTREKLAQAADLVRRSDFDAWMIFVRETAAGGDPALPLVLEGGLTWISALLVTKAGRRIAIVGNYDADPLRASGDWDEVIGYVQGIGPELISILERESVRRIGVNSSVNDVMADGISHGMYRLLESLLAEREVELVTAEALVAELRGVKTPTETARVQAAIAEGDGIFAEVPKLAPRGTTERELYDRIQALMAERGLGYAWDRSGNPIVNFGPDSMIGHGVPSNDIRLSDGQILHVDLGVIRADYASDIQRCWFVGEVVPEEVSAAMEAVNAAISAGAARLRPGARGLDVDAAARAELVSRGYPEYLHALGHQVGRVAHDGGGILGPAWDRYGDTPYRPILEGQIYTLELGITVPGRGYLGLEEIVQVTADGVTWLSERQLTMPTL